MGNTFLTKEPKIYNEERKASSISGIGKLERYMQRTKQECHLTPYAKINSQWITSLNVRLETIKCIEENIGTKIMDLGVESFFLLT